MTLLSLILSYFPALILGLASIAFIYLCAHPGWLSALSLFFVLYGLPPLTHRLHHHFYPIAEGISYLSHKDYSPWWGSHQLQVIYIALPALEAVLRLVPGVFSLWLRLWGSRIGKKIYWTPGLEIADRSLLQIGNRVVFGHRTGLYSHIIKPRRNALMLYVKTIEIGDDVFIGAGSHIGPGVQVEAGAYLSLATQLYPNQQVKVCDG